jgi:hypothetical protein
MLRGQGYRTTAGLVGNTLFWMVVALSALTVWTLLATWRHMRRRAQIQNALINETNFRRAMENSMLTGMRATDMDGRITYVNPAFCAMTGYSEPTCWTPCRPSPTGPATGWTSTCASASRNCRAQPGRRHRGQGPAQGRLQLRRAPVRVAADRPAASRPAG